MKKIYAFSAALAAVAVLAGCSKIEISAPAVPAQEAQEAEEGDCILTFTNTIECDDATKTEFDGNTILWSVGDEAKFLQYIQKETAGTYVLSGFGSSENRQVAEKSNSYSVSVGTTTPVAFPAYYCAAFPFANYSSATFTDDNFKLKVKLPASQTPTATSFDKSADILISECVVGESAKVTKFNLNYYRPVAIAKMTVKNLPSSAAISKITFSAKVDGTSVALAGYDQYSTDGTLPDGTGRSSTSTVIALDYSELSLTADSAEGMTAYFTCFPFALAEGDSFKVQVTTTSGEVFTRNVTIPADRTLELSAGKGSVFAVDMSEADKTCSWASLGYSTTYNSLSYKVSGDDVASAKAYVCTPEEYATLTDLSAAIEANGDELTVGTSFTKISLTIDTEYCVLFKLVSTSSQEVILVRNWRTDWFKLAAATSGTTGKVQIQMYGVNLASSSKHYRIIATDDITTYEISDLEDFYTNTLKPGGLASAYVSGINNKAGAVYAFSVSDVYTYNEDSSAWVKGTMTSGTSYTVMIKVTNERGETVFRSAKATAK